MKKVLVFIVTVLMLFTVLLTLSRAGKKTISSQQADKLIVTTSFYPLYFFSSEIGKDKASVTNITPAGAEPHDYEPTTQDIINIEKSDLLIINGGIEPWGDKEKENLKGSSVQIIEVGTETAEISTDPHIWLDPILAKKEVEIILEAFIKADGANAPYYRENTNTLLAKLDQLDADYKNGLASCRLKDIVTSHAAFGYLAKEYGLNQVAISGLSPDEEPSSKDLIRVAQFARQNKVKFIFFESLVSPKLSQTIADEIGAKTLVLDPLEGITDESAKEGKNYFSVMGENLNNLEIALECTK